MVCTNKKFEPKDAYTATFTKSLLNSPEVCTTQTRERPSTNHGDHKKKLNNSGMEHSDVCRATHIKEHTEFAIMCVANSESIKREESLFFRSFLISRPNETWPGGHSGEKIHLEDC